MTKENDNPFFNNSGPVQQEGSPGGSVVRNLPTSAADTGSIPGLGQSHNATEQLSPCATTTEPLLWSPRAAATQPMCHSY